MNQTHLLMVILVEPGGNFNSIGDRLFITMGMYCFLNGGTLPSMKTVNGSYPMIHAEYCWEIPGGFPLSRRCVHLERLQSAGVVWLRVTEQTLSMQNFNCMQQVNWHHLMDNYGSGVKVADTGREINLAPIVVKPLALMPKGVEPSAVTKHLGVRLGVFGIKLFPLFLDAIIIGH